MKPVKIVVAGPVGAGKTAFVRSLSQTEVVDTDAAASEAIGKANTTVAMDFGTLDLDGIPVYLFGTPGQDRFDFVWDVLCEGALGLVFLVSGAHPGRFGAARRILEHITSRQPVPFLVGVTHQDAERRWTPDEVADYFDLDPTEAIGLDATDPQSALRALEALLENLVRARSSAPPASSASPGDPGP